MPAETLMNLTEDNNLITDRQLLSAKWVAYCSNKNRSVTECKEYTDNFIKTILDTADVNSVNNETIAYNIRSIFVNRGYDVDFLNMIFDYSRLFALAAVDSMYETSSMFRNSNVVEYFNKYIEKYGEDRDISKFEIKWYTLPENYSGNEKKVEELLQALS